MSNLVILEDGGAWKAAGWAWQRTPRLIAAELTDLEFAAWLEEFAEENRNATDLDLRQISPAFRPDFMEAAKRAYRRTADDNGSELSDPAFLEGWRDRFSQLISMIDLFEKDLSIEDVRSIRVDVPTRERRLGPAWDRAGSTQRDD